MIGGWRIMGLVLVLFLGISLEAASPRKSIPARFYRNPFLPAASLDSVRVEAFQMDERPVSLREFRDFVSKHQQWSKSKIKPLFADSQYLAAWKSDLEPPKYRLDDPVTGVSWFAAKAYCASLDARLPTTNEWELVATTIPEGQEKATYTQKILDWYSRPAGNESMETTGSRDAFGVRDLHGRVWEWTEDFNMMSLNQDAPGSGKSSSFFCGGAGQATAQGADYASFMRFSFRSSLQPKYTVRTLGFRCAQGERN